MLGGSRGSSVGLSVWEMWVVSNIEGGVKELPKTSFEEGPHTCLEGVPTRSQATRGSNPTSTCSFPKFGGVGGVNSYEGKKGVGVG